MSYLWRDLLLLLLLLNYVACSENDGSVPTLPLSSPTETNNNVTTSSVTPTGDLNTPTATSTPTESVTQTPLVTVTPGPPLPDCKFGTDSYEDSHPDGALLPTYIIEGEGGLPGLEITYCGDLTGDGRPDLVVEASYWTDGVVDGRLYVVELPITQNSLLVDSHTILMGEVGLSIGSGFDCRSDVTGDGLPDLVVGVERTLPTSTSGVRIFEGPLVKDAVLLPSMASISLEPSKPTNSFGWSVSSSNDVTGNGRNDVVVGAPFEVIRGVETGLVFIFEGPFPIGSTALVETASIESPNPSNYFGWSLKTGDVNGDSSPDIVVGAPYEDGATCGGGAVYVSLCPCNQYSNMLGNLIRMEGITFSEQLGYSLSLIDLNGDSDIEIISGAPSQSKPTCVAPELDYELKGRVRFLELGSDSTLIQIAEIVDTPDPRGNTLFGASISSLTIDGSSSLVAGSPGSSTERRSAVGSVAQIDFETRNGDFAPFISVSVYGSDEPNPSGLGHGIAVGDLLGFGQFDIAGGAISYEPFDSPSPVGAVFIYDQRCLE